MLDKVFEKLPDINEDLFKYYEVDKFYDVSVNFIEPGAKIPVHTHDQEVFNYVLEGEFVVEMNNKTIPYKKGDWINIPAKLEHAVETKVKTVLLELWKK